MLIPSHAQTSDFHIILDHRDSMFLTVEIHWIDLLVTNLLSNFLQVRQVVGAQLVDNSRQQVLQLYRQQ